MLFTKKIYKKSYSVQYCRILKHFIHGVACHQSPQTKRNSCNNNERDRTLSHVSSQEALRYWIFAVSCITNIDRIIGASSVPN